MTEREKAVERLRELDAKRGGSLTYVEAIDALIALGWSPSPVPAKRADLIDFMRRVNPLLHEPLASRVAEEWADKFLSRFGSPSPVPMVDREQIARVLAVTDDYDGCFERIDEWEALPEWEKLAHPDNEPMSDREDAEWWLRRADALLASGLLRPIPSEEEIAEALHYAQGFDDWGIANETEREWSLDLARAVRALLLIGDKG